jgi:hypothetical protein
MVRQKRGQKRQGIINDDEGSAYEVEKIVGVKFVGKKKQYQIKWKGYTELTWQTLAPYVSLNLLLL